ncbi:MAG: DUF892 family protein [Actinomycetia bacterium]|nr:DUF892 family protein [Actinomycetes bacterium]
MATPEGLKLLVRALEDAHAIETEALEMLTALHQAETDPELRSTLERHHAETRELRARVDACLRDRGKRTSGRKERQAFLSATVKGFSESLRGTSSPRNISDWYVTEHREVAAFAIVARVGDRLGAEDVAQLGRDAAMLHAKMGERAAGWFDYLVEQFVRSTSAPQR